MSDHPFRAELFDDPLNYEETHLRDRKSDLYGLLPKTSSMDARKKAEFVRDVIAMANTASWRRDNAYLLMGIKNEDESKENERKSEMIVGLEESLRPFGYGSQPLIEVAENVRKAIKNILDDFVTPRSRWSYYQGEMYGKPVAYLLIEPDTTDTPYHVRKNIKNELSTGQCWIRSGESKGELRLKEFPKEIWTQYIYVPHPLPSNWKKYFANLYSSRMFQDIFEIQNYIELHAEDGRLLNDVYEEFLQDDITRLLVIEGEAGSGKSTYLQKMTIHLADDGLQEIEDIIRGERFSTPPGWIPLYFSLRGRNTILGSSENFARELINIANKYGDFWKQRPLMAEKLFEDTELSWLICLDGMDELGSERKQQEFIDILKSFLNTYPRIKVVLTTRPYIGINWNQETEATTIKIRRLFWDDIRWYIEAEVEDKLAENILSFLNPASFADSDTERELRIELLKLLKFPAYLRESMRKLGQGNEQRNVDVSEEVFWTDNGNLISELSSNHTTNDIDIKELRSVILPIDYSNLLTETSSLTHLEDQSGQFADDPSGISPLEEADDEFNKLPPIGQILDAIYQYLWNRETERHRELKQESDEWWERTSQLAYVTSCRTPFKLKIIENNLKSEELKYRVLNLGIVTKQSRTKYSFLTSLTQAYFTSWYLIDETTNTEDLLTQVNLSFTHCQNNFKELVCSIISDISNIHFQSIPTGGCNDYI